MLDIASTVRNVPSSTPPTTALANTCVSEKRLTRTIVSSHPHRLCAIPAREGVRREARVYEGEVSTVEDMVEVVVVAVDLRWRELSFVDDVLR